MTTLFVIAFWIVSGALIFAQAPATGWLVWMVAWVATGWFAHITGPVTTALLALIFVIPSLVLTITPVRREVLSKHVFDLFRAILPQLSIAVDRRTVPGAGISVWHVSSRAR